MNPNQINCRIICLTRDQKRLNHVIQKICPLLKTNGIDFKLLNAVDGENLKNISQLLKKYKIKIKNQSQNNLTRSGQLGCLLSHYQLWLELKAHPHIPYVMILEDDSLPISSNFKTNLYGILSELPRDFDFVYLYVYPDHYRNDPSVQLVQNNQDKNNKYQYLNRAYFTYCTLGYIISQSGIQKLLTKFKEINAPIDTMISQIIEDDKYSFKAFSVKENIVNNCGQNNSELDTISGGDLKSNIWNSKIIN